MPPGVFTERLKKESSLETEAFLGVGPHEVAVEAGDVVHADAFRAGGFTFILVRAVAKAFRFHLLHHGQDALGAFRLALREQIEVGDLGGREQHGRGIFAGVFAAL